MKVLLVNGSPHKEGCTYTALKEVEKELIAEGIETEIIWLGVKPISGCLGCAQCIKRGPNGEKPSLRCFMNDCVNEFLDKAEQADGFIFGSPVHYAALSGALTSFMDRAFYGKGKVFRYKPAAGIVSARRGGTTAAFDQVHRRNVSNRPIPISMYAIVIILFL